MHLSTLLTTALTLASSTLAAQCVFQPVGPLSNSKWYFNYEEGSYPNTGTNGRTTNWRWSGGHSPKLAHQWAHLYERKITWGKSSQPILVICVEWKKGGWSCWDRPPGGDYAECDIRDAVGGIQRAIGWDEL